jgi:hypothetical protein
VSELVPRDDLMRRGARRDWRKICAEVLLEKTDTVRLNALLEELLEALEERAEARGRQVPNAEKS